MKNHLIMAAAGVALALAGCGGKSDVPAADTATIPAGDASSAARATTTFAAGIAASPTLKTLADGVRAAGLGETLSDAGPFTVFAPTDGGFAQVPPETRDGWMRPAQKAVLAAVINYHVVPGRLTAADLAARIAEGGGKAVLRTASGQDIVATKSGDVFLLTSASGNKATVTQADVGQSNGVIHIIDAVLVPQM